jgi:hypothetical protein
MKQLQILNENSKDEEDDDTTIMDDTNNKETINDAMIFFKKKFQELLNPLGIVVYEQLYFYIWIMCFYHILLVIIVFVILYLNLRMIHQINRFHQSTKIIDNW